MAFHIYASNTLLICYLATPGITYAVDIDSTGAGLLRDCQEFISTRNHNETATLVDSIHSGRCLGNADYVTQAVSFYNKQRDPRKAAVCMPPNITLGEIIRVTIKFIENNPDMMHQHRATVMSIAMADTYRCKS